MRRMTTMLVALVTLTAGSTACAPRYDGFSCEMINETPSGAVCTDLGIEVARGEALVVRLAPQSESRTEYEDATIELRPVEPQIADVRASVGGDQTVLGLTIGETMLEVWVDGVLESDVPVRVVESEPSAARD